MNVDDFYERLVVADVGHFAFALDLGSHVALIVDEQVGTEFGEENIHASAHGVIFVAPDFLQDDFSRDELVLVVAEQFQ